MIFNITKIRGGESNKLLNKKQADKLSNKLSELDWLKLNKLIISFRRAELTRLEFLIPFVEFINNLDMKYLNDSVKLQIEYDEILHRELLLEAYKIIRSA